MTMSRRRSFKVGQIGGGSSVAVQVLCVCETHAREQNWSLLFSFWAAAVPVWIAGMRVVKGRERNPTSKSRAGERARSGGR